MSPPSNHKESSRLSSKEEGIPADDARPTTPKSARKPVRTSLERKLELLEARFTMPAPFPSASAPATATADPHTKSPSEATLGPFSSPNASVSAHSFGFGTPSLSNLSSNPTNLNLNNNNSNNDNSQPLPPGSIRNKRRRCHSWTQNNLQVVSLAAEKHMRRVAASSSSPLSSSPTPPLQHQREQQLNAAANRNGASSPSQLSAASESNQTLITGHLRPTYTFTTATATAATAEKHTANATGSNISFKAAQRALVVQESPPLTTPAGVGVVQQSVPRSDAVRAVAVTTATTNTTTFTTTSSDTSVNSGTKDKKRKSIPTKNELPSVKENCYSQQQQQQQQQPTTTTNTTATTEHGDRPQLLSAPTDGRTRKRTRLPFTDKKTTVAAMAGASHPPTEATTATNATANAITQNPPLGTATTATTRSTTRKAGAMAHAAPASSHNTSIYDFFNRKGSANTIATTKAAAAQVSPHNKRLRSSSLSAPSSSTLSSSAKKISATATLRTPSKQAVASSVAPNSRVQQARPAPPPPPQPSPGLDKLRQRCQELERLCQDRDEQLAAVSNNRTIVHTALQQALVKTQKEMANVKAEQQVFAATSRRVLEDLSRSDAAREARELRERLATDGARLGKIVYTRAGMRSVETWEDGRASKQLLLRKTVLQEKRQTLEQRQAAAKRVIKQVEESKENQSDVSASSDHGETDLVGGIHVRTPLEAMEAFESVRFHLSNVRRQEKELVLEDQTLNDEKCAHIRALKRVASEDSSRFRSRPKLHDRYVLRALLGKGGFSEVWKAYDLVELREVAVKIHQLDPRWPDAKKENYTKHVSREYEIHRNVRHPRIVSLFDVFEIDNNSFATVLELCNGTDLDAVLKDKKRLAERDARAVLLQILLGMQYLSHPSSDGSRQGIIHYDLKPGNILFDEFGDAKITDFGLSKIVDAPDPAESMELTSQGAGTYWYLPPECFVVTEHVRISNKVDVWSIGVIFYQMLYGKRPFGDGQSQDKILTDHTMLNAHKVTFPDKPVVSDDGKQFIRACLTYDQAFRPTIAQVCQNPYVVSKQF